MIFSSILIPNSLHANNIQKNWYILKANQKKLGYYHETVEQRDGKLYFRYRLKKFESGSVYTENYGAIAQHDLTPITFNLTKSAQAALDITDASFRIENNNGVFDIRVSGARNTTITRQVSKETILDVFFPLWISKNWTTLENKRPATVRTFIEDQDTSSYRTQQVMVRMQELNPNLNCTNFAVEIDGRVRGTWCMQRNGVLVEFVIVNSANRSTFTVQRVPSESVARQGLPTEEGS